MNNKQLARGRGRPGITREDVERAVRALREQGRRIGPTNVRLELGGRGSRTTITKHLRVLGLSAPKSALRLPEG